MEEEEWAEGDGVYAKSGWCGECAAWKSKSCGMERLPSTGGGANVGLGTAGRQYGGSGIAGIVPVGVAREGIVSSVRACVRACVHAV